MELAQYAKDVIPSLKEIDKGYPLFWFNPNKVHGFRMTNRAFDIIRDRSYRHWAFTVEDHIVSGTIILMDQKITHPYHINSKRITFFYEPMAIAMALSNNNVDTAVNLVYC